MRDFMLVGVGGFVGSVSRYYLGGLVLHVTAAARFPWSTLAVNTLGCLLIGLVAGAAEYRHVLAPGTRLFLLTGILGAATVLGACLIGWPTPLGVILTSVKRSYVRGTWVDSHFGWQIRTFWWGLLWACLCAAFVVMTLGIGIIFVWLPLGILALWFIYRIARGWLALNDRKAMPV